jgi:hypothetical protein
MHEVSTAVSSNRRDFLRMAAGSCLYSRVRGFSPLGTSVLPSLRKTVVVTFGGGARDDETSQLSGQKNIPHPP